MYTRGSIGDRPNRLRSGDHDAAGGHHLCATNEKSRSHSSPLGALRSSQAAAGGHRSGASRRSAKPDLAPEPTPGIRIGFPTASSAWSAACRQPPEQASKYRFFRPRYLPAAVFAAGAQRRRIALGEPKISDFPLLFPWSREVKNAHKWDVMS